VRGRRRNREPQRLGMGESERRRLGDKKLTKKAGLTGK
jgi:hypothetical protein